MRKLAVVIPSKDVQLLNRAVASIYDTHLSSIELELIIVDDGLAEKPTEYHHITAFVTGKKPFCYSRNINAGILASKSDSDIFVMNDDAFFISPEGLTNLQRSILNHPRLGIVTPVFTRAERTPSQRLGHLDPRGGLWIEKSAYLTFAGAYLRREMIREIGLLDESFIGYGFEDNDLSLRATLAGFDLGVLPSVVMGHGDEFGRASKTFRTVDGLSNLMKTNRSLFIAKWARTLLKLDDEQVILLSKLIAFL